MIGLISDTHENVPAIEKAVALLKSHNPELVIHAGDIISPPVLPHFSGLPMRFVFGNNDGERAGLNQKAAELGFPPIEDIAIFSLHSKSFFVYHGTRPKILAEAADSQKFDYIITGHTHQKLDQRQGITRIINPGALFKANPLTIALLDPVSDQLEFLKIPN